MSARAAAATIRISSPGHAALAATFIALGGMGLASGAFTQIWQPVPKWVPLQGMLVYACAIISVACGVGLVLTRVAPAASRVLLVALLVWIAAMRLPNLFYQTPLVLVAWSFGATAVMAAGVWLLHDRLTGTRNVKSERAARVLFGVSLIPFGLAHFMYMSATAPLIPAWLPWHTALAYATGAAFIAAGLAIACGILASLAAALITLQIGLFGLVVWLPRVFTGNLTAFQRGETITTFALTAAALVVAESYRERTGSDGAGSALT